MGDSCAAVLLQYGDADQPMASPVQCGAAVCRRRTAAGHPRPSAACCPICATAVDHCAEIKPWSGDCCGPLGAHTLSHASRHNRAHMYAYNMLCDMCVDA